MTFREAIDSVLRRLREDTIGADWAGGLNDAGETTDYQKLIGEFVNEAKREVEDAWNWTALRSVTTLATVDGTSEYTITGVSDRHRLINTYRQSDGGMLQSVDASWIKRRKLPTDEKGLPSYYSTTATKIQLHPTPDSVESIDLYLVDPQDDLSSAATTITVNANVVVLGAVAKAISERGEDGGTQLDIVNNNYANAVADLVAQDVARVSNELEWQVA